jgi:peptidoglycan/LPS O-acetylase OafA/YrhL
VASFADVAFVQHAQSTTNWVFRSTDTRAGAFLVGAALAVWWTSRPQLPAWWRLTLPARVGQRRSRGLGWLGVRPPSLIPDLQLGLDHRVSGRAGAHGRAGQQTRPAGRQPTLPGRVMGYLGRRSYALYMWHYVWLTWLRNLGRPGIVLALAASLASAELSWRLVEAPALRLKRRFTPRQPETAAAVASATHPPARPATGTAASE